MMCSSRLRMQCATATDQSTPSWETIPLRHFVQVCLHPFQGVFPFHPQAWSDTFMLVIIFSYYRVGTGRLGLLPLLPQPLSLLPQGGMANQGQQQHHAPAPATWKLLECLQHSHHSTQGLKQGSPQQGWPHRQEDQGPWLGQRGEPILGSLMDAFIILQLLWHLSASH